MNLEPTAISHRTVVTLNTSGGLGMAAHISTSWAEAGGSGVQGRLQLHSKFEAIMIYVRLCLHSVWKPSNTHEESRDEVCTDENSVKWKTPKLISDYLSNMLTVEGKRLKVSPEDEHLTKGQREAMILLPFSQPPLGEQVGGSFKNPFLTLSD